MAVSDLHRQVAFIALAAAASHGFALGGGNALLAHGLTTRPTQDVDLFTDQEHGVEAAAAGVEKRSPPRGCAPNARTTQPTWPTYSQAWARG
jgi:hypothetical protein